MLARTDQPGPNGVNRRSDGPKSAPHGRQIGFRGLWLRVPRGLPSAPIRTRAHSPGRRTRSRVGDLLRGEAERVLRLCRERGVMSREPERGTASAAEAQGLRADAERNRERVLAAAREVFAEQGLDASTNENAVTLEIQRQMSRTGPVAAVDESRADFSGARPSGRWQRARPPAGRRQRQGRSTGRCSASGFRGGSRRLD